SEVFYNGAGIDLDSSDPDYISAYEYAEGMSGEIYTGLFAFRVSDVADYVREKTGSDYANAEKPLEMAQNWDYLDSRGIVYNLHGDTNMQPIEFYGGTRSGDIYRLRYTKWDSDQFYEPRDFIMTAEIKDGCWRYISNLPAAYDAPRQLASVVYCRSEREAERAASAVIGRVDAGEGQFGQDGPAYYMLVTALADGVTLYVDKEDYSAMENAMFMAQNIGFCVITDNLAEYRADKGESIIVKADLSWIPEIRLSASDGVRYGEYWVGDDIWKYYDYDPEVITRDRVITGYSQNLVPYSDGELNSLMTGSWVYYNPATGDPDVFLFVDECRDADLMLMTGGSVSIWMRYTHLFADETKASDCIGFYVEEDSTGLVPEGLFNDGSEGDYFVSFAQEGDARVLILRQANNGDGCLSYLLGNDDYSFTYKFYRYEGKPGWQGEYKRILKQTELDAAMAEEYAAADDSLYQEFYDSWYLYDIDDSGIPELIVKRGSCEADYHFEIYTIGENGTAVPCFRAGNPGETVWASHMSLYSVPAEEGGGLLLWQGHMGWAYMERLTLEGTELLSEELLEEELMERWQNGEEGAEYTQPEEVIAGAEALPYFHPGTNLPVDTYAEWTAGEHKAAGFTDEPDYFHAIQNEPGSSFIVCPGSRWLNNPGRCEIGEFLDQGVIYEYSPDNLIVQELYYIDLDADGLAEAVMYVGANDSEASQYRVIFHKQNGEVYAYTDLLHGFESLSGDGVFSCHDEYYDYDVLAEFNRQQCFTYPAQ
ncbi:MAG: hypothetical protein J6P87_01105, partial [Lachnospiraceae bacterium]|nr:hypothetical protein [Lachnospiraceae bacterium]